MLKTKEDSTGRVMSVMLSSRAAAASVLIIAALLLFSNSLSGELVWDDKIMLKKKIFTDWGNLGAIFLMGDSVYQGDSDIYYYRPIPYLTFLFDYQVWKLNPFWYKLENILLHASVAVLFYFLICITFGDRLLAFISSLLFLVHPAVTECVNLVVSRNTILCTFFSTGSLLLLALSRKGKWIFAVLSLASYFLALLSKEQAMAIPLFLMAVTLLSDSKELKVNRYVLMGFFAVTALYLVLRMHILGGVVSQFNLQMSDEKPGMVLNSLFEYFRIMIYPVDLSIEYVARPIPFFSLKSIIALIGVTVLIVCALRKRTPTILMAAAAWLVVSFFPVSNIVPIPSKAVADRYVYLALMGMSLTAGYVIQSMYEKKQLLASVVFLLCILMLGALTYTRNNIWKTEESLWLDVVRKIPEEPIGYYNLGVIYKDKGFSDRAVEQYMQALQKDPKYLNARLNLGIIYHSKGYIDEAINTFKKIIEMNPAFPKAYYNLGLAYYSRGQFDKAIEQYKKAITYFPAYSQAYNNMGSAYKVKGNIDEAIKHYRSAIKFNPESPNAHNNLGSAYRDKGLFDKAIEEYKVALTLDPSHKKAADNLRMTVALKEYVKKQISP